MGPVKNLQLGPHINVSETVIQMYMIGEKKFIYLWKFCQILNLIIQMCSIWNLFSGLGCQEFWVNLS